MPEAREINNSSNGSTIDASREREYGMGAVFACGATLAILGAGYLLRRSIDKMFERLETEPEDLILIRTKRDRITGVKLHGGSANDWLRSPDEQLPWSGGSGPGSSSSGYPSAGGSEPLPLESSELQSSLSKERSTDGSGPQSSSLTVPPPPIIDEADLSLAEYKRQEKCKEMFRKMSPSHVCPTGDLPEVSARVYFIRSAAAIMGKVKSSLRGLMRSDDSEFGAMRPVAEPEPRPEPSFTD